MRGGLARLLRPCARGLCFPRRTLATVVHPDLFAPSTTTISTSSPASSSQRVLLPPFPELYDPGSLDKLLPPSQEPLIERSAIQTMANPVIDAWGDQINATLTKNGALAYGSSGSACLDVFSGMNAWTEPRQFNSMLSNSWLEDPLATLRLIWHLRSIHEGQSANAAFYRAFAWLYNNHPRTAILNLRLLVDPVIERPKKPTAKDGDAVERPEDPPTVYRASHGYYKDLLNILVLATNGELTTTAAQNSLMFPRPKRDYLNNPRPPRCWKMPREPPRFPPETRDARVQAALERNQMISAEAREAQLRLSVERSARVERLLANDKKYKALYVAVARIFADDLARDLGALRRVAEGGVSDRERIWLSYTIGLAAKWAPSPGGSHDRHTNIATAVADLLYRGGHLCDGAPLSAPLTHADAHRLRGMYARWVLTPLRRFAQVTESHMSARRWDAISYRRVPSKCMAANAPVFFEHDEARFSGYLQKVAAGSENISGATLLPHELLITLGSCTTDSMKQVVEAQWDAMVQNVRNAGVLDNCLAVCDTSGSMGSFILSDWQPTSPAQAIGLRRLRQRQIQGRPDAVYPALALSLVLAQTARAPWNNCFITFSETPELQRVDLSKGLSAAVQQMNAANWGMNTDYNAIFTKLILPVAMKNRLRPNAMIKRLFVFSDMEFDDSRSRSSQWSTEHKIIETQFNAAGYAMPELVYWNLQGAGVPRPVDKDTKGTALVTGFSPNMLKMFMAGEDIVPDIPASAPSPESDSDWAPRQAQARTDPFTLMQSTLARPSFSGLRLAD